MQKLVSMNLTNDQLVAVDAALDALETNLSEMVAMTACRRRSVPRVGGKSDAFCRQTLSLLTQNPQVVNPSLGLDGQWRIWRHWTCCVHALQRLGRPRARRSVVARPRMSGSISTDGSSARCKRACAFRSRRCSPLAGHATRRCVPRRRSVVEAPLGRVTKRRMSLTAGPARTTDSPRFPPAGTRPRSRSACAERRAS